MGIGAFSSESQTKIDTRSTAFNTGFSEIGGPATSVNLDLGGKIKVGKGGSVQPIINLTDQGAVNAALAISDRSIRSVEQFGNNLTGLFEGVTAAIRGQGSDAIEAIKAANREGINAVSSANRTELENLGLAAIKWGALAFAGYLAVKAFAEFK